MSTKRINQQQWLRPWVYVVSILMGHWCTMVIAVPQEEPVLNLYTWYDVIPQDILNQFEQEYGIRIHSDVYDSNEILEAKLLTGKSGYDLVNPSVFPYLARQIKAKLYQPLRKDLLPNAAVLDPLIMDHFVKGDPEHRYAIPLVWGLVGFAYNSSMISALSPEAPTDSWALFYDPQTIKALSSCHVSVLEEGNEVIIPLFIYMGFAATTNDKHNLFKALWRLREVRPYITRFDALRSSDEIFSGQLCLAMHWVGTLERTRQSQDDPMLQENIKVVVPKEGTVMWIDAIGIPKSAPHPHNAHVFINFLLRPDIMARITNHTYFANAVPASKDFINPEIVNNSNIYPPAENFKKFYVNQSPSLHYQRYINRMMLKFRMNWFD